MKKKLCMIICLVVCLSIFAGCSNQSASPDSVNPPTDSSSPTDNYSAENPMVLKFGHQDAVGVITSVYADEWAKAVTEATEGRIVIDVYPAGQLGSTTELMSAVEYGTLDVCFGDITTLGTVLPEFDLLSLPFLYKNEEQADAIIYGEVGQEICNKLIEEKGMRCLLFFWNGFRNMCTTTEINSVEDMQGIKIRSPEADIYMDTFELLGMNPTPIPWGEAFTAMQTGVVEGVETPPTALYEQEFYTLGKYICKSNHIFSALGPMINENVWQKISEKDREIILQVTEEIKQAEREEYFKQQSEVYDNLEAAGAVVTEITNREELISRFTPYWSEIAEKCDGQELLDQILSIVG